MVPLDYLVFGLTLMKISSTSALIAAIFTTLKGEDVESRRKLIEENALDVKNLDI